MSINWERNFINVISQNNYNLLKTQAFLPKLVSDNRMG